MMSRAWRLLAAAAVLVLALAPLAAGSASAQAAAPSPSPTVGSANSPAPAPPGSTDSSPRDYNGAILVVVGVLIVAVLVGGGTLFLNRTRRIDLNPQSTPEDENEDESEHASGDKSGDESDSAKSDRSSIGDQSATDHHH